MKSGIEGNIGPGEKVAILDDVITTGGSTITAIERAREAGLVIDRVIALIDREEGGRENIAARVGRVDAVLTRTEIMARYRKKYGSISIIRRDAAIKPSPMRGTLFRASVRWRVSVLHPETVDGAMRPPGRFGDPVPPAAGKDERYRPLQADPVALRDEYRLYPVARPEDGADLPAS